MSMSDILAALDDIGPMKQRELATFLGLGKDTIFIQLKNLRRLGKVHIARYEPQPDGKRGSSSPVFAIGAGEDAPKPRAKTQQERTRSYRARNRVKLNAKKHPVRRTAMGVWVGLGALPVREVAQSCSN